MIIWLNADFFKIKNPRKPGACDLAGTRTQDPYIKSVLLYQLSYQINFFIFGVQR